MPLCAAQLWPSSETFLPERPQQGGGQRNPARKPKGGRLTAPEPRRCSSVCHAQQGPAWYSHRGRQNNVNTKRVHLRLTWAFCVLLNDFEIQQQGASSNNIQDPTDVWLPTQNENKKAQDKKQLLKPKLPQTVAFSATGSQTQGQRTQTKKTRAVWFMFHHIIRIFQTKHR